MARAKGMSHGDPIDITSSKYRRQVRDRDRRQLFGPVTVTKINKRALKQRRQEVSARLAARTACSPFTPTTS